MFRGVRPIAKAKDGIELDGSLAATTTLSPSGTRLILLPEELAKRDLIESQLAAVRKRKDSMEDAVYFATIEPLMIELAEIYRDAESRAHE